jgi:predicted small metal-binding protein
MVEGGTIRLEATMAYSAACADTGADCPGNFTVETKDELVEHLNIHLTESHPGFEMTSDEVDQLIKVV